MTKSREISSKKGGHPSETSLAKIQFKMKKQNNNKFFKKQLLLQNVQLDSSVNFQTNGDINILTRKTNTLWNK